MPLGGSQSVAVQRGHFGFQIADMTTRNARFNSDALIKGGQTSTTGIPVQCRHGGQDCGHDDQERAVQLDALIKVADLEPEFQFNVTGGQCGRRPGTRFKIDQGGRPRQRNSQFNVDTAVRLRNERAVQLDALIKVAEPRQPEFAVQCRRRSDCGHDDQERAVQRRRFDQGGRPRQSAIRSSMSIRRSDCGHDDQERAVQL